MKTITRRIIAAAVNATRDLLRLTLSAGMVTVARYLHAHGADQAWIKRWGSAFGARVAKGWRASHDGANTGQVWDVSGGKVRQVYGYRPGTADHLFDEALAHYRNHPIAGLALAA